MAFNVLGKTKDLRTNTNVVYCKCSIPEYLELVGDDFESFFIQRRKENHKAYERLKSDLKAGALLPSITLSVKMDKVEQIIRCLDDDNQLSFHLKKKDNVDILDGLQRTFILKEILSEGHTFASDQEVLLEFWLEYDMSKLIYRMIVLNAGQKAMSVRHQIELLFMSLKEAVSNRIEDIEIFAERDQQRRTQSNKYSLGVIASSYQAFLMETTEIDKDDVIARNLIQDNVMDAEESEHTRKFEDFLFYFKEIKEIDSLAWSYYETKYDSSRLTHLLSLPKDERDDPEINKEISDLESFKSAKSWLGSENTMLGLFCSISQFIKTGRKERVSEGLKKLKISFRNDEYDPLGIITFNISKKDIDPRKSNVGYATRKLILNGFKEYFRDEGTTDFSQCWKMATE
ncbi:hypothetical protein [Dickeya chrysanthemi]|uniref:hypothetical protein n=1 Tax=Dickeya chrysanthemi TaxID=556 RepID=UPI000532DEBA|nr:hypothetical protein [Dickeya chrysanthemi]